MQQQERETAGIDDATGALVPTPEQVRAAAAAIAGHVRRTPVVEWDAPTPHGRVPVVLKLEQLQHTGSFKPRGCFTHLLALAEPPTLVVTASGGNHGLAVAHAARELGLAAEVYVPASAPRVKVEGIRALGATAVLVEGGYHEASEASRERAASPGARYVHAYDTLPTLAGQGTVALELQEQAPDLTDVLVAVGGGGLAGGMAAWYGRRVPLVCVEPVGCPTFHEALAAGRPVDVAVGGLGSDALGARRVGASGFASLVAAGATSVLVEEDAVRAARAALWDGLRLATEPGGAAALAALVGGAWTPPAGARVGVVVCGANASPADLG